MTEGKAKAASLCPYMCWDSSQKCLKPARLLVGVLFHDFTRKTSFFRENGTQSRKWDRKSMKIFFLPSVISHRDTEAPFAPDVLLHLPKLRALPTAELGAIGSVVFFQCDSRPLFDTFELSGLENLRFFHPPKRDQKMEQTPTYNWADFRHFWDEDGKRVAGFSSTPKAGP